MIHVGQANVPLCDGVNRRSFLQAGATAMGLSLPTAMQLEAALGTAEEILEDNPNHLLGLSAAAKAAVELGRGDIAAAYYEHVLEVYESQIEQDILEYTEHAPITDNLKIEAEAFLGGR